MSSISAPTEAIIDTWLDQVQLAKSGQSFTPSDDTWRPDISKPSINVLSAKLSVPESWKPWLVAAMAYYFRERAQGSVGIVVSVLRRSAKEGLCPLYEADINRIRERFNGAEFGCLASFVKFWHQCEELPIRPNIALIEVYNDLPPKKAVYRDVVTSLDPINGPFTPFESDALFQWICDAYVDNRLSLDLFVYLRLSLVYGARAANIQQMVFDDFRPTDKGYEIRLPRAKSKDSGAGFRKALHTFGLSKDLYQLISGYKYYVLERLKLEYTVQADWDLAINNVPLFRRSKIEKGRSCSIIMDSDALRGLEVAPDSQFHAPVGTLRKWVENVNNAEDLPISERTGEKIHVNPHRFRYTVGTDMALEGYSAPAIAAALTHKGTSTVGRYIKTSPKLARRIDEKLKDQLTLVVNAFTGVIVRDRQAARNGEREDRQIEDLAVCGADRQCHLDAPLTCYPCSKFQPLLHADHERVLEELETIQKMSSDADQNTAAVYDRAILACRRVLHDCQQVLNETDPQMGGEV